MDDGLTLNIDVQGDQSNHTPHLGWRERKQQARERQAKKRQRYSKSHGSRPGVPPAAGAAGLPQQQQQQQQQQPVQQLQQPKQAPPQQPTQQQRTHSGQGVADAKPGSKRSADTLHGSGAVPAQQQPVQVPPKAASKTIAAAAAAAEGRPKKRPTIAETAAAESAAAEAMTADEQADIMALVQLNMSVEQQLEEEQRQQEQQQGSGKKGSKKAAALEHAMPGVVEFGDAPDELDAHDMLAKAGRHTHGKQQHQQHGNSSSASNRKDRAGTKHQQQQQEQQDAKQPQQKQQLAQHKVGEMAHAEPNVPAEQRQQLFGDAGAAGAGGSSDGSWSGLGLTEVLADHLVALNFQEPTQVQQRSVPALLAGRDALVRSPTGSGKTLAYLAPMLHSLQARQPRITRADGTHALILVPTRELAVQVSDVLTALVRRFCWLVAGMLIGGEHRGHEKARLRKGVTLLVATPGRLLDHLQNTTSFKTERLSWLVLDEADRLLDLGFEAKLKAIIEALAARAAAAADNSFSPAATEGGLQCQTVLLSATLHPGLAGLASLSMREPVGVGFDAKLVDGQLQLQEDAGAGDGAGGQKQAGKGGAAGASGRGQFELPQQLQQRYVEVPAKARLVALIGVLRSRLRRSREAKLVVFFSNCDSVDFHHALLQQRQPGGGDQDSYDAAAAAAGGGGEAGELLLGACPVLKLHGDMKQPERTSSLVTFSKAKSCVLLCTDVAARGLDFPAVSTIIQYDPSGDPAEYVHRVGRTARMGQQGEALLFLLPSEMPYVQLLQQQGVKLGQEQLGMLLQCLPALVGKGGPSAAVQQMAWKMRKGFAAGMGSVMTSSSKDGSSRGSGGSAAAAAGFDGLDGLPSVKPEQAAAALLLQRQLVAVVSRDAELSRMATSAFRSFVRAYTTHPSALKHVFYVKGLHLGHLAASFGLREAPSKIGAAGSAAERKKRKQEGQHAANKREKQAWHKNAKAAAAMGRG